MNILSTVRGWRPLVVDVALRVLLLLLMAGIALHATLGGAGAPG